MQEVARVKWHQFKFYKPGEHNRPVFPSKVLLPIRTYSERNRSALCLTYQLFRCGCMTSWHIKAQYEIKTLVSRNNLLRNRTSFNKHQLWHHNFIPALKLWTKSITKFWIIEINSSKLPSINTTYVCRRQSNSLKWYTIYLYLTTHYSNFSQPFRRRGTLDLALHISRYPLRKTSIFLNWFTFYLFVTWET